MNNFLKKSMAVFSATGLTVFAFAQEQAPSVSSAMEELSGKFEEMVNSATPYVLTIVGAALVLTAIFYGIKIFRRALKTGA